MAKRKYMTASRKKQAARKRKKAIIILAIVAVVAVALAVLAIKYLFFNKPKEDPASEVEYGHTLTMEGAPPIDVQLLTPNEWSRPQTPLKKINGIVIHYIGNPGSTAQANHDYFENLKDTHTTKASSHFLIGLDGEIIQNIPSTEIAYTSNERNSDTLSIETCHPDETGEFNEVTYDSLVDLTGWLCWRFELESSDVIRHHDVTGKICPKYFVEHPNAWEQFLVDVQANIDARPKK